MIPHRNSSATAGSKQSTSSAQTTELLEKLQSRLLKRILKSYDIIGSQLNPPRPYVTVTQAGEVLAAAYSHLCPNTHWPFPAPPSKIAAAFTHVETAEARHLDTNGILFFKPTLLSELAYKYLKTAYTKLQLPEDAAEQGAFCAGGCAAKYLGGKGGLYPALSIPCNEANKSVSKLFAAKGYTYDGNLLSIVASSQLGPYYHNLLYVIEWEDGTQLIALNMPVIMQIASKGAPVLPADMSAYPLEREPDVDVTTGALSSEQAGQQDPITVGRQDASDLTHQRPLSSQHAKHVQQASPKHQSSHAADPGPPASATGLQQISSNGRDYTAPPSGVDLVADQMNTLSLELPNAIDESSKKKGKKPKGARKSGVNNDGEQTVAGAGVQPASQLPASATNGMVTNLKKITSNVEYVTAGVQDKERGEESGGEGEQDVGKACEAAIDAALAKRKLGDASTPKFWLQRRLIQEMLAAHPPMAWDGKTPMTIVDWRTVDLLQQFWFESTQQQLFRVPPPFKQGERVFVENLPCFKVNGPPSSRRSNGVQTWTCELDVAFAKDVKAHMLKSLGQGSGFATATNTHKQVPTANLHPMNATQSKPSSKQKSKPGSAIDHPVQQSAQGPRVFSLTSITKSAKLESARNVLELLVGSREQRAGDARDFLQYHLLLALLTQAVEHSDWPPSLRCSLAGSLAEEKLGSWWSAATTAGLFAGQPCPFDNHNTNAFLRSLTYLAILPTPRQYASVCPWMCQADMDALAGDYWELVGAVGQDGEGQVRERLYALSMMRELGAALPPDAVAFMRDTTD